MDSDIPVPVGMNAIQFSWRPKAKCPIKLEVPHINTSPKAGKDSRHITMPKMVSKRAEIR